MLREKILIEIGANDGISKSKSIELINHGYTIEKGKIDTKCILK